ncbi:MAG: hypothetical protein OEY56_12485 [Cyclobacteriaceae bacterium]|nr:hypothetical protein [Cyclobacteriaceae bacterium]
MAYIPKERQRNGKYPQVLLWKPNDDMSAFIFLQAKDNQTDLRMPA